ncbi:helix-turn-helix domain-containing protein [Streptomyces sp. NPDC057702]|uniref:helix-turn-helix domain-containing protein n=1 Tax=unclassified Streptomyces TaxID=2593676 RepID=UPI0036AB409C
MARTTVGPLGAFLRARRARVRPEELGLVPGPARRVPGLRRVEVALLAGVSTDYYTHLEQGRERHPSIRVLDALATALRLDGAAHAHLRRLADPHPAPPVASPPSDQARRDLTDLVRHGVTAPAMLVTPWLEVVARNEPAAALYAGFAHRDNLARLAFLDPRVGELVPDPEHLARCTVATLRAATGPGPHEPRLAELIAELARGSASFRRLWDRHDVHRKGSATKHFRHPSAGLLTLRQHVLALPDHPGLQMWVYQPEPGSPSERALRALREAPLAQAGRAASG